MPAVLLGGLAMAVGVAGSGSAASPCGSAGVLSASGATETCTYTGTGEDTFTVPAGVSSLHVVAVGGMGGGGSDHAGGFGAQVTADLPVQTAAPLYVEVAGNGGPANEGTDSAPGTGGAGGFNGGGAGGNGGAQGIGGFGGGGGGGATDLRSVPASAGLSPDPRLLVAAGGGGSAANGGVGAGTGGAAGAAGTGSDGGGGQPGTLNGVGAGGDGAGAGGMGQPGVLGVGGAGGAGDSSEVSEGGGGAGGGYYGGGGGGGGNDEESGGGGGGASFVIASATNAMPATDTTGMPSLTISYDAPTSSSTVTTVSCASPVMVADPTNCTATVTTAPGTLAGSLTFSTDSPGSFSPNVCTLPLGVTNAFSCTVAYTPTAAGTHTITATYGADATHRPSSGSMALSVTIPPAALPAAPKPTPQVGTSAVVSAQSGTVTYSCGGKASSALGPLVATGCTINATQGSVTLTFATPSGLQTGTFSGGTFTINQNASGGVEITLATPAPARRKGVGAIRVAARVAARTQPRHLWATVHKGRYSLRGRNSVATVRGPAKWETIETTGGTRTVVRRGKVSVRNLHGRRSVVVRARHSYLAKR